MKTRNKIPAKIGFKPSYMENENIEIENDIDTGIENINTENPSNSNNRNGLLKDLQEKIVELTLEMSTKKFARLSQKTKLKRLIDYNLLVALEVKLGE